jgi:cell division protein YceG involved in septum cleavage
MNLGDALRTLTDGKRLVHRARLKRGSQKEIVTAQLRKDSAPVLERLQAGESRAAIAASYGIADSILHNILREALIRERAPR